MNAEPFTFGRFEPGVCYGTAHVVLDSALLVAWEALPLTRRTDGALPPGLLAAVIMRAYTEIITPRPPGNIHGSQSYDIRRLPRPGERLETSIRCDGKEIRKGRNVVVLGTITRVGEEVICLGKMTMLVAA